MKLKERIKNIGFWVSIMSSIVLILGAFGVEIGDEVASSVINGVCSLLVVFGIVSDPTTGKGYLDEVSSPSELADVVKTVSAEIEAAKLGGGMLIPDRESIEKTPDAAEEAATDDVTSNNSG